MIPDRPRKHDLITRPHPRWREIESGIDPSDPRRRKVEPIGLTVLYNFSISSYNRDTGGPGSFG